MKKSILTTVLIGSLLISGTVFANLIDKPAFKTHYIKFTTPAQKIDANGVEVYVYNPVGSTEAKTSFVYDRATGKPKIVYGATATSDSYGDSKDVMTAIGLYVQLTNNTNTAAVVSWKNSSISYFGFK